MNNQLYQSHKKMYIWAVSLCICGLIALFFYHYFDYAFYGIRPPCGFKVYFNGYCPGCGGTRAFDAFLHGHFIQSIFYHPVIVYLFILFLMYFLPATFTFLIKRNGKLYYRFHVATLWGLLALVLIHFIGRNILLWVFGIDYLQDIAI